jgi:hypothetical protein
MRLFRLPPGKYLVRGTLALASLMVLVVVDPVDGGFRGRPQGRLLSFEELVRRGLLDQTERSVTVCFGERAEGIEADLDGDGRLEVLIAGVTGEAVPAGYPADVKGYLRIVRRLPQGGYEVVWRLPLSEEDSLLLEVGLHHLDADAIPEVGISYEHCGTTYGASYNTLVYYLDGEYGSLRVPTHHGPYSFEDLDEDGVEEVVIHRYYGKLPYSSPVLLWWDIFRFRKGRLENVSEGYPKFYERRIADYYLPLVEKYRGRPAVTDYVELAEDAIRTAKKLVQAKK